jgi:hypothetical protein
VATITDAPPLSDAPSCDFSGASVQFEAEPAPAAGLPAAGAAESADLEGDAAGAPSLAPCGTATATTTAAMTTAAAPPVAATAR